MTYTLKSIFQCQQKVQKKTKDNTKSSNTEEESKLLLNVDESAKGKDVYCF